MRTRKRIISVFLIISMVATFIPHAFAVNNTSLASASFEGTIEFDTPMLDPTSIEIKVYSAVPREKEYEWLTEYDETYAFSVYPNENGFFSFTPPAPDYSITVEIETLPTGYGIVDTNQFFTSTDTKTFSTYVEEIVDADLIMDSLSESPKVVFKNNSGNRLFASYEFIPCYEQRENSVIVTGSIIQNDDILFDVSTEIDLTSVDPVTKANLLYEKGIIDESQKIQHYLYAAKTGQVPGELALMVDEQFSNFTKAQSMSSRIKTTQDTLLANELTSLALTATETLKDRLASLTGYKSSTNFELHYNNSSISQSNATIIINFLEQMLNYSDAIGFRDPICESGKSKIQVYMDTRSCPVSTYANANGLTYPTNISGNAAASYITLWNFNASEMSKFKETVAHEFFYAVQNAYYYPNNWFKEASAVWFSSKYSGSIERAKGHFNNYFRYVYDTISKGDLQYGAGVLPMAIDIAYGSSPAIRRIYERMATSGASTETALRNCITYAIQRQDSSGSFAEAYKKLGAYVTMPGHFYSSIIPPNATWTNTYIDEYVPNTNENLVYDTIYSYGCRPYRFNAGNNTAKTLKITFSFPYASSTNHSVRLVRVNDLGTVIPFGGDATADKYTAFINNFCTANSSAGTNHDIVYATPINIGTTGNNFFVYYQLQ